MALYRERRFALHDDRDFTPQQPSPRPFTTSIQARVLREDTTTMSAALFTTESFSSLLYFINHSNFASLLVLVKVVRLQPSESCTRAWVLIWWLLKEPPPQLAESIICRVPLVCRGVQTDGNLTNGWNVSETHTTLPFHPATNAKDTPHLFQV